MAGAATTHDGDAVLAWLESEEAAALAETLAHRRGLSGVDALAENVLQDARVAMWRRIRSAVPLEVRNPAAYGTVVIKSVLRSIAQGRSGLECQLPAELGEEPGPAVDPAAGDDLRLVIANQAGRTPWLTSAALTYMSLLMHPGATPDDAPRPAAGATPDQARCWPALWYAGIRDLFAEHADAATRKRRARRIRDVLDHVDRAFDRYRTDHG